MPIASGEVAPLGLGSAHLFPNAHAAPPRRIWATTAIGSPHILQLSGVGDLDHLGRIGVPVVHELRGVGKNMQHHYVARVSYRSSARRPPTSARAA